MATSTGSSARSLILRIASFSIWLRRHGGGKRLVDGELREQLQQQGDRAREDGPQDLRGAGKGLVVSLKLNKGQFSFIRGDRSPGSGSSLAPT